MKFTKTYDSKNERFKPENPMKVYQFSVNDKTYSVEVVRYTRAKCNGITCDKMGYFETKNWNEAKRKIKNYFRP